MTASANDAGPVTLRAVIENVRENERLYENLDVRYESNYSRGDSAPRELAAGRQEIMRQGLTFHAVSQDNLFRVDRRGSETVGSQGSTNANSNIAFDGSTTRLLQNDAIGNIVKGRETSYDFLRPHTALLSNTEVRGLRLATYLSGYEAVIGDPDARWPAHRHVECAYKGEASYKGLNCHLVWATTTPKNSRKPYSRWEFWLSEKYNYIPVRILGYTFGWSEALPLGEHTASDFREVRPGLWFPHSLRQVSYEPRLLKDKGTQVARWTRTLTVREASVDPHYDKGYFQGVSFPARIPIYEVENDKIKRSYVLGGKSAPRFRNLPRLVTLAAGVLLGVALVWGLRSRRSTKSPPP